MDELVALRELLERVGTQQKDSGDVMYSTYLDIKRRSTKEAEVLQIVLNGISHYKQGRFKEAIKLFDSAISLEVDGDAYYNRGVTYMELGDLKNAIGDFSGAIWFCPQLGNAYHNRALCILQILQDNKALSSYMMQYDLEFAKSDLRKSIELGNEESRSFLEMVS